MVGLLALLAAKPGQVGNEAAICGFNKCQGFGSPPQYVLHCLPGTLLKKQKLLITL